MTTIRLTTDDTPLQTASAALPPTHLIRSARRSLRDVTPVIKVVVRCKSSKALLRSQQKEESLEQQDASNALLAARSIVRFTGSSSRVLSSGILHRNIILKIE